MHERRTEKVDNSDEFGRSKHELAACSSRPPRVTPTIWRRERHGIASSVPGTRLVLVALFVTLASVLIRTAGHQAWCPLCMFARTNRRIRVQSLSCCMCPTRILAPVSSTGHVFSKAQEQNSPSCVGAHLTDRLQSNVIIIYSGIAVLSGGHQFEYGRVNNEATRKIPEIRYCEVVLQISCTSRGSVSLFSVHTDYSDSLP